MTFSTNEVENSKTRCNSSKDRARLYLHLLCTKTKTTEETQLSQNTDGL